MTAATVATSTTTGVPTYTMTLADASVVEGDAGTRVMRFTATLSHPAPAGGLSFHVATQHLTTSADDFVPPRYDTWGFSQGSATTFVDVAVIGDTIAEPDETFRLSAGSAYVNGVYVPSVYATAIGTIVNDDGPVVPTITLGSATVQEPVKGTAPVAVEITLNVPATKGMRVFVKTVDGTAKAKCGDYRKVERPVNIRAGATSALVPLRVCADRKVEDTETFSLVVTKVVVKKAAGGWTVAGPGVVTILDNDRAPAA